MRILIVEDNPKTALSVQKGLATFGISADVSHSGVEGEELAAAGDYDLVLLDQLLPDRGGPDVCRNLRARNIDTPILMLTALSSLHSGADGLQAGATDALTKPFAFEELLARVRAFARREPARVVRTRRYDDLELDLASRTATRGQASVVLSKKELALLEYLMRHPDRVISRTQIGGHVWGSAFEASSNVIDVYVSTLRRKIDRGHERPLIHTIKGAGYRFGSAPADEPA